MIKIEKQTRSLTLEEFEGLYGTDVYIEFLRNKYHVEFYDGDMQIRGTHISGLGTYLHDIWYYDRDACKLYVLQRDVIGVESYIKYVRGNG